MEFTVEGMTCGHCARAVTNAVRNVDPTASVEVHLPAKRVSVQSPRADAASIEAAISAAGYEVARRAV